MSVREREFIPDRIYFITYTIYKWIHLFTEDKYFHTVYKWFVYISEQSPDVSKLVQNAKRFQTLDIINYLTSDNKTDLIRIFSESADLKKGSKHKVFKGRFDSKEMVNAEMYREKLNYIHNNPCTVKWQLAERPEDYLHSSASNYINGYGIYDVELIY